MPDKTLREHSPLGCVSMERIKQDAKWGKQNHDNYKWLAILSEEFGEAGKALCEMIPTGKPKYLKQACLDNLEYELIQIAAVCVAWVECMRHNESKE